MISPGPGVVPTMNGTSATCDIPVALISKVSPGTAGVSGVRASGFTEVVSVDELFDRSESVWVVVTFAVLVIVPVKVVLSLATTVYVIDVPAGSETVSARLPVPDAAKVAAAEPTAVQAALTNCAGRVSVTVALTASAGPALATRIV